MGGHLAASVAEINDPVAGGVRQKNFKATCDFNDLETFRIPSVLACG
jgi:hypothetical protein